MDHFPDHLSRLARLSSGCGLAIALEHGRTHVKQTALFLNEHLHGSARFLWAIAGHALDNFPANIHFNVRTVLATPGAKREENATGLCWQCFRSGSQGSPRISQFRRNQESQERSCISAECCARVLACERLCVEPSRGHAQQ